MNINIHIYVVGIYKSDVCTLPEKMMLRYVHFYIYTLYARHAHVFLINDAHC